MEREFHIWLRNKNTIEFLGIWEEINNPGFNSIEFERIKNQAGFKAGDSSGKAYFAVEHCCDIPDAGLGKKRQC